MLGIDAMVNIYELELAKPIFSSILGYSAVGLPPLILTFQPGLPESLPPFVKPIVQLR